ncbi:hypothetical protein [Pseudoxanthomonas sp. UTMC 1351]|uniref:hypothetical protein n=1 Tax=Pseudoxanthomonas sp. UTMC 1351 TaxID=2695853 RepID=UPI0034CF61A0
MPTTSFSLAGSAPPIACGIAAADTAADAVTAMGADAGGDEVAPPTPQAGRPATMANRPDRVTVPLEYRCATVYSTSFLGALVDEGGGLPTGRQAAPSFAMAANERHQFGCVQQAAPVPLK